jgi:PAS domain S-box-containing protein
MATSPRSKLRAENEALRLRAEEAEQSLEAIRTGEVESLVVEGPDGPRIFTLEGASHSYRVLVESMNEGAVTSTEAGIILYCNARFAQMLGQPLQKVIGSSLRGHIPEASRAAFDDLLERARQSAAREELPLRTSDGQEIPAYLSASSIVDGGRRVLCIVATDLREQKRNEATAAAERAARESEERLRQILRHAVAGAWEWDIASGALVWSPESYQLYGIDPAKVPLTRADWERAVHPDDVARTSAAIAACVEGRSAEFRAEFRVVNPRLGERWLLGVGRVDRATDGTPLRMLGINIDITERKRAEADLAVVTRLYAVLSRVNEAIVRVRDERTLYEEVCRIVAEDGGFPLVWVGLVEGRDVEPVACWGRATAYVREIKVQVEGDLGQGPTGTCIREHRSVINDDFSANPSTWPWREPTQRHGLRASAAFPLHLGGKIIGAITFYAGTPGAFTLGQVKLLEALCADVSYALDAIQHERLRAEAERALRESEQSLREGDRRKDEFLGMLSHELRNPLAPIRHSTYVLRHAQPGSEQAQRAQTIIEHQSQHLTRLVDDLLDVTRIARGKIELRRERSDLREVVRRTAEDLRPVIENRGVAFRVDVPAVQVWADVDVTRVAQAIGNLLHNAAKFTQGGDSVTLSLDSDGTDAHIRIADTGAGIDAQLMPRIFTTFVQGERTLARSEGGLGLGLALVKGIVELHGGTVAAESAGTGHGAQFTIRLPAARRAMPEQRPPDPGSRASSARRVLVVDDNVDAAESLADALTIAGHEVEVAFDGPSAIEKVRSHPPDVVLCDIGLPGMSGYDVARQLRASGVNGIQLVALSGYAQPEDVARAVEAGFDGHIAKPCDPEDIERLLR